jgi:hypothetical protein
LPSDEPPDHRGPKQGWLPHGADLYVAGWAHFRAGQFDDAISLLEQACAEDAGWRFRGVVYPVLAMAYQRSGQGDAARETLAAAERSINQWTLEMSNCPLGVTPLPWFDWIECLVLFREASIVITGFAPPDDPRLRVIEQRAQNALLDSGTNLVP